MICCAVSTITHGIVGTRPLHTCAVQLSLRFISMCPSFRCCVRTCDAGSRGHSSTSCASRSRGSYPPMRWHSLRESLVRHRTLPPNRVLKKSFSRGKTCEFPKKFEGQFSKTCLFQHPVRRLYPL